MRHRPTHCAIINNANGTDVRCARADAPQRCQSVDVEGPGEVVPVRRLVALAESLGAEVVAGGRAGGRPGLPVSAIGRAAAAEVDRLRRDLEFAASRGHRHANDLRIRVEVIHVGADALRW